MAVRPGSRIIILTAVFSLFAAVGLTTIGMQTNRISTVQMLLRMALAGGFGVGYAALAMTRRFRYFLALIAVQVLVELFYANANHPGPPIVGAELESQLVRLAVGSMFGILLAYSLMFHVFRVEGRRYFQLRTEMALAAEIHRSLVRPLATKVGGFEIYGASVPSGEVGGDLVDLVERPGGWIGYVADVSGHGVPSAVLMAMFKTALRSQMARESSPGTMLGDVHRTLFPLKLQNMFVTVGMLQGDASGQVLFASAGHPAILHYQKKTGTMREYPALDPPLGIAERQEFSQSAIRCGAGDVLLVLTDGLTEVFDAKSNEMGLEAVEAAFQENANSPLEEIFSRLRKVATEFGPQTDDQTVLLARFRG
jgi:sigma-B regulation protein RsbU (phosphoserine phosphatase)